VRRILGGERAVEVAKTLGRSEGWIFKWLSRYDPSDEGWAVERSRAPQRVPGRSEGRKRG
jgi:transposase